MAALRSHFRPEFLNRVDDTILFHPLSKKELRQIVGIQIKRLQRLLADQKIKIELSQNALNAVETDKKVKPSASPSQQKSVESDQPVPSENEVDVEVLAVEEIVPSTVTSAKVDH